MRISRPHGLLVFAPTYRYCGVQTNKGAYLKLDEHLRITIQQFYADRRFLCADHDSSRASIYGGGSTTTPEGPEDEERSNCSSLSEGEEEIQVINRSQTKEEEHYEDMLKKDTVSKIVELILYQKPNLYSHFTKMDSERQQTRV